MELLCHSWQKNSLLIQVSGVVSMWNCILLVDVRLSRSIEFAPNVAYVHQCVSYSETCPYFEPFTFYMSIYALVIARLLQKGCSDNRTP